VSASPRRDRPGKRLLSGAALLLVAVASAAAQTAPSRVFRLAELAPTDASLEITRTYTLPELARLGFREGDNLRIEERAGAATEMPALAHTLLQGAPDAIVAIGPDAARAATSATKTVPIVTFGGDPVRQGYAASLAHPGGNVTGVIILAEELDGKRLDILHEAVPRARRIAALIDSSVSYRTAMERVLRESAAATGLALQTLPAAGPDDYAAAFAAMRSAGADALLVTASAMFNRDAELLARLASEARLPVMCEWAENAQSGCLLGYGPNRAEGRRRVAYILARIFNGAVPGELPIETPTHFSLAVNLKTAKALAIELPPALLTRADDVIE
jgi:putative ABC transport system substrate-binding protein